MKIFDIGELSEESLRVCGGKARGLDFLKKNGLSVPDGFVIIEADLGYDEAAALAAFDRIGADKVSVRSSADNEDGGEYSGAGQYETYLDVDRAGLIAAVDKCVSSLESVRASAYAKNLSGEAGAHMNVVVQKMIRADHAGVMFTVSPDNADETLIEAVEGLGENLVSGKKSSVRYSSSREKFSCDVKAVGGSVSADVIERLYREGMAAEKLFGVPADLEWAEEKGEVYWLQIRAVTAFDYADIDEFNTANPLDDHLITTRNIGEMMPGAITPLSISTSVLAIDYGIRNMLATIGAIKKVDAAPDYYTAFSYRNHLFIDMTALHSMSKRVIMASPPAMNLSIMGEYREDYPPVKGKNAFIFTKTKNGIKFAKYLFSSEKAKARLAALADELSFSADSNDESVYKEINEKLPAMNKALCDHYICSSFSGAMNSGLYMVAAKKFASEDEYRKFVSAVLSDIDGIESADILASLKKLGCAVKAHNGNAASLSDSELSTLVTDGNNKEINELYNAFMQKHGHRSIKEAELRSKSWKNNPLLLMRDLRAVMKADCKETEKEKFDLEKTLDAFPGTKTKAIKWLVNNARKAVIDREFSKSRIIKVIDKFKDRYSLLAELLVKNGLLSDADCIYFLTHAEIGELINGKKALKKKAIARRAKFKESEYIKFDDVMVGTPKEVVPDNNASAELKGIAVCKGKVYGKARIVRSVEDAENIKEGEIMVAAYTDIGWSPYYSLVGALVTEVGSALSHGAVVAREYCLPTIVNVKNATSLIKDGDDLFVDADNASVSILDNKTEENL